MADYSVNSDHLDGTINLAKFIRILRKRWVAVAAIGATLFAGVAVYTYTRTPIYESSASLLIDNSTISVSELPLPDSEGNLTRDVNLSTEIAILKSRPLIESATSKLKSPFGNTPKEVYVQKIADDLVIRQEKNARVLRLTYRDTDPQRAQDILKSLTKTYVDYSLSDRRTKSSNAIKFIQAKLPQVKKQLDKSALAVTQFRKKHNIVEPDAYAAAVYQMKQALEVQLQDLQIKTAQTQQQYNQLQKQVGKSVDAALGNAILSQDGTYQNLVKQYQEAETNYFLERTRFQEDHPAVLAIKDRRDQLYNLMQVQAQMVLGSKSTLVGTTTESSSGTNVTIKQTLASQLFEAQTALAVQSAQIDSIKSAQRQITAVFAEIPQLQQTFTELQRQLTLDSSTYTKLSEKLEELRITEAQEISSWRLLDPPLSPIKPVSPNILLNLLLGGFGGLALGVAMVIWLERSDERIREVGEVRELTDIPLLGTVPRIHALPTAIGTARPVLTPGYTHSAFTESLRSLALNLRYLGSDQSVKTIVFTSAVPSEGKSTVVYHLGSILTELGHKVLVVDADMRKPTMHKLAEVANGSGLSTAIATNRPWRQTVQVKEGGDPEGLHVITSGPLPPNPIALLESTKMSKLMQVWRNTYDYVLIDTPPIVGITDAQSLAAKVDAVVLVAAMERSTRTAISRAVEILIGNRCNIAGILINMLDKTHDNYYYDYYSSYYHSRVLPPSEPTKEAYEEELQEA